MTAPSRYGPAEAGNRKSLPWTLTKMLVIQYSSALILTGAYLCDLYSLSKALKVKADTGESNVVYNVSFEVRFCAQCSTRILILLLVLPETCYKMETRRLEAR